MAQVSRLFCALIALTLAVTISHDDSNINIVLLLLFIVSSAGAKQNNSSISTRAGFVDGLACWQASVMSTLTFFVMSPVTVIDLSLRFVPGHPAGFRHNTRFLCCDGYYILTVNVPVRVPTLLLTKKIQDFPGPPWEIFHDIFGGHECLNIKKNPSLSS